MSARVVKGRKLELPLGLVYSKWSGAHVLARERGPLSGDTGNETCRLR